jgi:transposase
MRPGFWRGQKRVALYNLADFASTAVIQHVRHGGRAEPWIVELLKRKPPKLAAVALANKTARIARKLIVTGETYSVKSPRPAVSAVAA